MTSTMSAASAACRISLAIASGSSGCTSLMWGRAPISPAREASKRELLSVTSPGPSADDRTDLIPGRDDRGHGSPGDPQPGEPGSQREVDGAGQGAEQGQPDDGPRGR